MTHINLFESLGWKTEKKGKSLEEVHKSIPIPKNLSFWKKLLAFAGPGYLVAVGYMDPGNWATDIAGGSKYGYSLLWVILLSSFMAMVLQYLAAKLGVVSGRDLAQACRDNYPKPVAYFLWILAEIAIIACDLAEVLGSAIALNLLFKIPLILGVIITALDVFLLLLLQQKGFRYLEALVVTLIGTILLCFGIEIFLSKPEIVPLLQGFIVSKEFFGNNGMLLIGIGILGATVMPHNLYLHSAIVQTRNYEETIEGKREAIKFTTIDSNVALFLAFFVNAAILIVSAATFHKPGIETVAEIQQAYTMLAPLLGTGFASIVFAIALLASGQNSTITGTLAGQIVMEGFTNFHIKPWIRRLFSRALSIIPAVIVIYFAGENSITKMLILSQVVLSLQLSFAVFPLVFFTSDKQKMGPFVNGPIMKILAYTMAILIAALNGWLLISTLFPTGTN
ncbi:MAG: Nramp family divalent metal transporter [bacterium]